MRFFDIREPSARSLSLALAYDTACAAAAMLLALWLAYGDLLPAVMERRPDLLWISACVYSGIALLVYLTLGQHKATWRYTSVRELLVLIQSATLTIFLFILVAFLFVRGEGIPRTAVLLAWLLQLAFLSGPRLIARLVFRSAVRDYAEKNAFLHKLPVLLVGAGPQAQRFVRALNRELAPVYKVFGAVSADGALPQAWSIADDLKQTPLMGTIAQFPQILKQVRRDGLNIRHLILADGALEPSVAKSILPVASDHGMILMRVRTSSDPDSKSGGHSAAEVLPLALQDVMPRVSGVDRSQFPLEGIKGRRVLITGAGGTIGTELARQIAALSPSKIGLLEKSEFNLFTIDEEVARGFPGVGRETILCNVRDAASVDRWFEKFKPEIVFHAAALKHVPMVEAHPIEAILTNVEGTRIVADACVRHGVKAMIMISSDKAVNPTSVMGATKRLSEAYCQALDLQASGDATRFIIVRFGNVLWSTGSVVTRFRRQLSEGLPLTVTHPEVVRFFITIDEAVTLVLFACSEGLRRPGQRGTVTVLNMGEPVRILDLARLMTMLAGKRPDIDVPIQYIGLRPGESLSEELIHQTENLLPSEHKGILIASPRPINVHFLRRNIDALIEAAQEGDVALALRALQSSVPEYRPARAEAKPIPPAKDISA